MADRPSKGLADIIAASTAPSDIDGRAALVTNASARMPSPSGGGGSAYGWTAPATERRAGRLIRPDSEYVGERGLTWTPLDRR
jgi:hypothetical protein